VNSVLAIPGRCWEIADVASALAFFTLLKNEAPQLEIRSAKAKFSRTTVTPTETGSAPFSIGPAYTKEWNSPRSPQGSTPAGSAESNVRSNSRPTKDCSSFVVSTQVNFA